MNVFFDESGLSRLLEDFSALCGIRASVLGKNGRILCAGGGPEHFCELIGAHREGSARCARCGERAAGEGVRPCRCHAGVCAVVLPIRSGAQSAPLAWLSVGPFLDAALLEEQWERARASLDWFTGDVGALRRAFLRLRRLGPEEQAACAGMLEALADCVQHRDLIRAAGETDLQRLEHFLNEHYMDKLSLASVSAQLHIGRTRLCALAKQLSGGHTLFYMIAQRRIERAKDLLIQSDSPVSAVAEAVGISDYNYFSKVFRAAVGFTPSEFRKRARRGRDARG